jgi:uncharacterized protein YndB with AHSA1/START domain
MAVRTIEREIMIDAPVDVVWTVLTEPEHIATWFTATAELDVRPGGTGELGFRRQSTSELNKVQVQVEAVEPPHRFEFRWTHPAGAVADEHNSLLVRFTLVADGPRTRLSLVETGFDEPRQTPVREEHELGWDACLASLVAYAAGRTDTPATR